MVRVLIVDDSPSVRDLLKTVLAADPEIVVAGVAVDGEEAVAKTIELQPDVISMDLRMPRVDGVRAIAAIMHERPTPIVALYANDGGRQHRLGLEALKAGALELVEKPRLTTTEEVRGFRQSFGSLLKLMAEVKVIRIVRGLGGPFQEVDRSPIVTRAGAPVAAVGICASTGGPSALESVLARLPSAFPAPIFVVQHIADGFLNGLVEWVAATSPLRIEIATDTGAARPGSVYFAPEGRHLVVDAESRMHLTDDPPVHSHRPSGNVLLESLGEAFGERAMAVVLTGMGEDGASGAEAVARAGGLVLAQDEASSIVYGMPRAVAELGVATEILPLEAIAARVAYWARA